MIYGFSGIMRNNLEILIILGVLGVLGGEKPLKSPERSGPQ